jgi:predicted secreted protein
LPTNKELMTLTKDLCVTKFEGRSQLVLVKLLKQFKFINKRNTNHWNHHIQNMYPLHWSICVLSKYYRENL